MKKTIGLMTVLLFAAFAVQAATTISARTLSVQEQAKTGANIAFDVKYSDFSTTATNTAETLTFDVAAGQGFYVVYAKVKTEFVGAAGTDSLTLIVGDGDDADQFLTSMEMATESTEVSGKFGTTRADGIFYEAADTIDFKFTPNAENATSGFTAGEVVIYAVLVD